MKAGDKVTFGRDRIVYQVAEVSDNGDVLLITPLDVFVLCQSQFTGMLRNV